MGEFTEVRATIFGHENAAELAHAILSAGLASSIDIAEVPAPHQDEPAWELTLVTPAPQAPLVEERLRQAGLGATIVTCDAPADR
ncbi:hypothetical protein SAMN05421874_102312 [Nonomuraea maritima]|uniref:ACT domain-containing protein n=1 Tax=Nonomuraea maritima TaxID=683260 RepID=A0A1G8UXL2_9ACTN|nr:hypothetical protein [Nonomuraea maritima]SDJ58538.1 hypothetical protein SAMN05421874_102312 [Nonomuraea maritima]